jgi:alpha-glutamyl/putrescinyl thymine pyrophosphorylase clade 1
VSELHPAPESLFWYWIAERHAIYLRRERGDPKPWTTDPILRDYKFTNPFRENDRGTVWLRENFLAPHRNCQECKGASLVDYGDGPGSEEPCETCGGSGFERLELIAFNICWYRMFNWWGTGELLGWQTESWWPDAVKTTLHAAAIRGEQVFTGAHIVYSTPGLSKIDCIVNVCDELFQRRSEIVEVARKTRSLQLTFDVLTLVHCVGGFMAYEMVTDMRHTRILEDATDIMTWANPGPGARRGLQRLSLPSKGEAAIESMRMLLRIGEGSGGALWNAVNRTYNDIEWRDYLYLEMRDIEHSLCEFDKYCRVKFGEGEPRSKYPGAA